jgi:uncharacterized protein (UPF0303 family)
MIENIPNFIDFTHKQALLIGLDALKIVSDRQLRRIGIRIVMDDILVFQYLMDGKNEDNYLKGKEKVVKDTQRSSMFVFEHKDDYSHLLNDTSYCVNGGAIPIVINDQVRGSISISGMTQELDHSLALEILTNSYNESMIK